LSQKVVVETVFNGWSNGDLDVAAEDVAYGFGHDVRGAVAQNVKPFVGVLGDRLNNRIGLQRGVEIHNGTVDKGGNDLLPLFVGYQISQRILERRCGRNPCFFTTW